MGYARIAEAQGHWPEALQRWRRVQEVVPDNPWAWIGQGNALLELGEFDEAESVFQGARARWPDQPGVLTGHARAAMLQQRWAEALDRWRDILCVRQELPQAWIGQGKALLELGELEEAEAILREAQSRWPDHPAVLMGYARTAEAQGHWIEALQRWMLVEAVSPNNEYARMEQANALIELGELDRAEELCLSEQAKWPNNIRPYYLHHLVLERCRRKKEH